MAASMNGSFEPWLVEKLSSVSSEFDTDIFVTYIAAILDTDDADDEKTESITELLSGVVETEIAADTCKSILNEWKAHCDRIKNNQVVEDIGDKLSEILANQNLATVKEKTLTNEEKARKNAILAQYAQVSDGDESDEDEAERDEHATSSHKSKPSPSDGLLAKNSNKEDVQQAEREMREKAKQESEKKKEKDKQDRQAQKSKKDERKDAEKKRTQKGEKRR